MPAQRMETPITIAEAVLAIQKRDYLLPSIQRDYVWTADKTIALFDSLLRGFPVGSFLFWRVDEPKSQEYKFYEFMQYFDAQDSTTLSPYDIPLPRTLTVILDGQQRLTSLTIGLLGYRAEKLKNKRANKAQSYPKKRLYLNLQQPFSKREEIDREYDFRFLTDAEAEVRSDDELWFPVRKVLDWRLPSSDVDMAKLVAYLTENKLNSWGGQALTKLATVLIKDQVIHYFREDEQSLDRVLNVFVRLNSGGIPLSYSDLLLSIASAQWKSDAREAINGLCEEINAAGDGFSFNKDFVLKSALVLTDLPDVGFSVDNFGKANTAAIEAGWDKNVRDPLVLASEFAAVLGYNDKTLTSTNALVPVAYYLRKIGCPANFCTSAKYAADRLAIKKWLVVALLKSAFSSKVDTMLTAVRSAIRDSEEEGFPLAQVERAMATHGITSRFSDDELDELLTAEYGRAGTFSILAALYPSLNTQFKFHQDHIFAKSSFHKTKLRAAGFTDDAIERVKDLVNQMPNLQLLEGTTNQEKQASPFDQWLDKYAPSEAAKDAFCGVHCIPRVESYGLSEFEVVFSKRRTMLKEKLREVLA